MTTAELNRALEAEEVLAQELSKYAGRWVAVDRDRTVVADAESLEALLQNVNPGELDRILDVASEPVAGCFY